MNSEGIKQLANAVLIQAYKDFNAAKRKYDLLISERHSKETLAQTAYRLVKNKVYPKAKVAFIADELSACQFIAEGENLFFDMVDIYPDTTTRDIAQAILDCASKTNRSVGQAVASQKEAI